MKKSLRLSAMFLAILITVSLFAGCGNNPTKSEKDEKPNSQSDVPSNSQSKELKIEEIDWSVDEGVLDGERYVMLSYTNNSEFTISDFKMTFKEKSDLTDEQKEQFFEDIKIILGFDESDPDDASELEDIKLLDISMWVESEQVCHPGESASNVKCYYYSGYFYLKNIEHFNLCEPDIATIKYADDNTIYTVYYDFKTKKFTKDNKTEVAFYWTEKEVGNMIPKPKADIVSCGIDFDDSFSFDIHGWTLSDFNAYVKECKEKGFTVDQSEFEGFYSADNETGYNVYLNFNEDNGKASVHISEMSSD